MNETIARIPIGEAPIGNALQTDHENFLTATQVMVFNGQYDTLKNQPDQHYDMLSLYDFRRMVAAPGRAPKKEALATIGSSYAKHDARCHSVQAAEGKYSLLRFDIDAGNPSLADVYSAFVGVLGWCQIWIYSTASAQPSQRRWRVLVPLLTPTSHDLRQSIEVVVREMVEMFWDFECDAALDRAGQHIYLPVVQPDKWDAQGQPSYYEYKIADEPPFDFQTCPLRDAVLNRVAQKKRDEELRNAAAQEAQARARERRAHAQTASPQKLSPIEWFNQNSELAMLLVEAGYQQNPADDRDWRSPLQTSGSYATRVYDSYFVSLSSSDAAAGVGIATRNGHRIGDAFSIFLHFFHNGDRNSALQEIRARRDFGESSSASKAENHPPLCVVPISQQEVAESRLTPRVIVPNFLYADVRTRIAAGGSSKTTLALFEAVNLALRRPAWGRTPDAPVRTVMITREDSREILVARIREIMHALMLDPTDCQRVLDNLAIIDLTHQSFRLSSILDDVVIPNYQNLKDLTDALLDWKPDWVICDPLVSFGVGESRVNDAEQGLIEAFRILRNQLNCCVEGIHHTGKTVARDKVLDQYAGRGGSALADGCRMVAVMQPLGPVEWLKATGKQLADNESGLVMALPKMSFSPPQPSIYIARRGYYFWQVDGLRDANPDEWREANADRVHEFLLAEYREGRNYSRKALEENANNLGLTRQELRDAYHQLMTSGRVLYHEYRGTKDSHFEPLVFSEDAPGAQPG